MNYGIAYCGSNGRKFSDTEPYIEEAGTSLKECQETLRRLVEDGCGQLIPFEVRDILESYTWDYVNRYKVLLL